MFAFRANRAAKATRDSDNRIDCVKTQEENNCHWKNEKESNPMVKHIDKTVGIFGTDCWYRGKYGNFLLDVLHDKIDQFENYEYGNFIFIFYIFSL